MLHHLVTFAGSSSIGFGKDLDLGDHVVFVVVGKVKKETRADESIDVVHGIKIHEVRLLQGLEALQAEADTLAAASSADAGVVLAGRPKNVTADGEYFDPEAD